MRYQLHHGDCLDVLKTIADCSVDAIVTDPPYGLSFMGKRWDYDVPTEAVWVECLRVLKPGGHLLAFAGTRTQHRMAVRIEDAGFEIRDMIAWVYGSGMPKSFNLKRSGVCDCVPAENALPYTYEQNTKHNVRPLQNGDLQEAGSYGKERGQILLPILPKQGEHSDRQAREKPQASDGKQPGMEGREVYRAEERVCDDPPTGSPPSQTERLRAGAYLGSGKDARKATGGKRGGSSQEQEQSGQPTGKPASVLKPLGTLDEGALHGCGQCQRCGKIKKNLEGFGTALKPALEPITLARKPLIGTVAANVLEHGTGGLNIDGCRVGTEERWNPPVGELTGIGSSRTSPTGEGHSVTGRWPANFIHDGSDEVLALFPEVAGVVGARREGGDKSIFSGGGHSQAEKQRIVGGVKDTGSAARFFYCAKASRDDRDEGCGISEEWLDSLELIIHNDIFTNLKELSVWEIADQKAGLGSNGAVLPARVTFEAIASEKSDSVLSTLSYGNALTEKLLKGIRFTTSTGTSKIIDSKTLSWLTHLPTSGYTADASRTITEIGLSHAESAVLQSLLKAITTNGETAFLLGASNAAKTTPLPTNAKEWLREKARGNIHSTVKPTDLMRYLCRLITPPNGIVLDPFTGSGSTGKAAMAEGFKFIGIEREAEYIEIARARISAEAEKPRQLSLF